jgi:hypothetical protein
VGTVSPPPLAGLPCSLVVGGSRLDGFRVAVLLFYTVVLCPVFSTPTKSKRESAGHLQVKAGDAVVAVNGKRGSSFPRLKA